MTTKRVLGIAGSLREGSYNKALLRAAGNLMPQGVELEIVEIGNLPFFSEDHEVDFPTEVQELKDKIKATSAILVVTPEYNRSVPGVLKNAIDWTSRPYGQNAWEGKTVYVTGVSIGTIGTALAQYHLKQSLLYLDAHVIGQPELYIGPASERFDDEGNLTDEKTKEKLREALQVLVERAV